MDHQDGRSSGGGKERTEHARGGPHTHAGGAPLVWPWTPGHGVHTWWTKRGGSGLVGAVVLAVLILAIVAPLADRALKASKPPPPPRPNVAPAAAAAYVAHGGGGPAPAAGSGTVVPHLTKRALLFGLNYRGSSCELHGCIDDVDNARAWLLKAGFPAAGISMMTDDTPIAPTKQNMMEALAAFVAQLRSGDTAVVYFSGHGSQEPDPATGRLEECICPLDWETADFILGSTLRKFWEALPAGVKILSNFDSCHSMSLLNFHYCTGKDTAVPRELGDVAAEAAKPPMSLREKLRADVERKRAATAARRGSPSPAHAHAAAAAAPVGAHSTLTTAEKLRRRAEVPRRDHKMAIAAAHRELTRTPDAVQAALAAPLLHLVEERLYAPLAAHCIDFAGCTDAGTSADAFEGGEAQGGFSYAFFAALAALPPNASLNAILIFVRNLLKTAGYTQQPQLSLGSSAVTLGTALMPFLTSGAD